MQDILVVNHLHVHRMIIIVFLMLTLNLTISTYYPSVFGNLYLIKDVVYRSSHYSLLVSWGIGASYHFLYDFVLQPLPSLYLTILVCYLFKINWNRQCWMLVLKKVFFGRTQLKNVENYVVVMVTWAAVVFLSYLRFIFLPVHMKETILFCFYRYLFCLGDPLYNLVRLLHQQAIQVLVVCQIYYIFHFQPKSW